jgi:uncharacterized protein (DUF2249 family)/iron-sulfur cluster repair protein YtfE (RIC family)
MEKEKMTESTSVTFDVREMKPEERRPAIVARMSALQPGETLRLVSNHDHAPLQAHFLAEHPQLFTWESEQKGPEAWVIRIQKRTQDEEAPSREPASEGHAHETSHVIQCMQCGLQFQAEAVTMSHEGALEEHLVCLCLPKDSSPAQRTLAEELYERVEEGGTHRTLLTQPLRDEHLELLPHIERLRTVADAIGIAPNESVREGVEEVYTFLTHQLTPHAQAEERVLYPTVGRLLGAPEATTTMSRDHREIEWLTQALGTLRSQLAGESLDEPEVQALRRILYGLYALVAVHFAKEEEIYLPLLDTRLTEREAQKMFKEMEQAAQEAKRTVAR